MTNMLRLLSANNGRLNRRTKYHQMMFVLRWTEGPDQCRQRDPYPENHGMHAEECLVICFSIASANNRLPVWIFPAYWCSGWWITTEACGHSHQPWNQGTHL